MVVTMEGDEARLHFLLPKQEKIMVLPLSS